MKLTDEEKRMYQGEYGSGTQKAITMLIEYGQVFGAEKMIKVHNAHTGVTGGKWTEEMLDGVRNVRAFTTTHAGMAGSAGRALGLKEEFCRQAEEDQRKTLEMIIPRGFIPAMSCAPYMVGNVPTAGRAFSWPGSQGIIVANSVFGARGNRDAMPASMSSAITGVTPDMLLMQNHNRYGQVHFKIEGLEMENFTEADYGAIGYFIGGAAGTRNVVVEGIPENVSFDMLKFFMSPQPVSGAVTICHVVGVTPEAPTLEEALGNRKPEESIKIGPKEYREGWESLHSAKNDNVEIVFFGCPHLNIAEIGKIARLLEGKKIASEVRLFIATSEQVYVLAANMGYIDIIEKTGGVVVSGVCIQGFPYPQLINPANTAATNSARAASYQIRRGINIQYGSTGDCINAAISGKWGR